MSDSTKRLKVYELNLDELINISEINYIPPQNLLELLNAHKIGINQSCGGFGTCTTCRVIVKKNLDQLHVRNELETERAEERGFTKDERLACQLEIETDLEIYVSVLS
ncbi:MAG: 2Fe-2S iron-sulfur cluster-binding protein [Pseudobdellovibrio sp.]